MLKICKPKKLISRPARQPTIYPLRNRIEDNRNNSKRKALRVVPFRGPPLQPSGSLFLDATATVNCGSTARFRQQSNNYNKRKYLLNLAHHPSNTTHHNNNNNCLH